MVLSLMYINLLNVRKLYQHLNVLVQLFITDRGLLHKLGEKQGYKSYSFLSFNLSTFFIQ